MIRWILPFVILMPVSWCWGAGPSFEDVTISSGVSPMHGGSPNAFSTGAAFFDWDLDGWPDLLVGDGQSNPSLYRNSGPPDFLFEDVSEQAGLTEFPIQSNCVNARDFTGDGIVDILLMRQGVYGGLRLLAGTVSGVFRDETATRLETARSNYQALSAFDADSDGDLDVVATRWAFMSPAQESDCLESHFLENHDGILRLATAGAPMTKGCGLVGALTDVNHDGWQDYVQINDFGPLFSGNEVFLGQANGPTYAWGFGLNVADQLGLHSPVYGMGLAIGDINRDQSFDLFATSLGEDVLWLGSPEGNYQDATSLWNAGSALGYLKRRFKWGATFIDIDNDGWEDLTVAAGGLLDFLGLSGGMQTSITLRNLGDAPLEEFSKSAGMASPNDDRSFAWTDYDRDGRPDAVLSGVTTTIVLRNNSLPHQHWLDIRLTGRVSNAEGLGSRVQVQCGDQTWVRELMAGGNPGSSSESIVHVGLGTCDDDATVTVHWPSGRIQSLGNVTVDTLVDVLEPNWFTVSKTVAAADGLSAVEIQYQHTDATAVDVTWTSTAGTTDGTSMTDQGGGLHRGILTAPATPGIATIRLQVNGSPVPAIRRVRFNAPETIRWVSDPVLPAAERPMTIGATLQDASGGAMAGSIDFVLTGATMAPDSLVQGPSAGQAHCRAEPHKGATTVTVQAVRDGVEFGPAKAFPVGRRVNPERSLLLMHPTLLQSPDDIVNINIFLLDDHGWFTPAAQNAFDTTVLSATLFRDGVPVLETSAFLIGGPFGLKAGQLVAKVPASQLGGAGTYTAEVDGQLLTQVAVLHDPGPNAADLLSTDRSTLRFMDRHVYADGEDIVPVTLIPMDAHGQVVAFQSINDLGLHCEGCEFLPDRTAQLSTDNKRDQYMFFVRTPDTPQPVTVTLTVDGQPTDLTATTTGKVPHPTAPDPDMSKLFVFKLTDPPQPATDVPGDGLTPLYLRILLKDNTGNLIGSGQAATMFCDCGYYGPVVHEGFGMYAAHFDAAPVPCTATISVDGPYIETPITTTMTFVDSDGQVVDTPCVDVVEQPVIPEPEPNPEPVVEAPPELVPDQTAEAAPEPSVETPPEAVETPDAGAVDDSSPPSNGTADPGCGCRAVPGHARLPGAVPTLILLLAMLLLWKIRRGSAGRAS